MGGYAARLLAHHHAELLYVNGPRMLPIAAFGKRWEFR
jgi:hypothetical protein